MPRLVERDGWVRGMDGIERYEWLKERGLCTQCGAPAYTKTLCAACMAKQLASVKRLRDERRAAGLCVKCGGKRDDMRYRLCGGCRRYARAYRRMERAEKDGH